nr:uncharacterized protein LOC131800164 isoform X2 [Pocillopora verrucosa]
MMAVEPSDAEIKSALADILRDGELSQLTSRIVRRQLEDKFGVSFLARKKEIDAMLMDMIEKSREVEGDKEQENGTSEINGVTQEEDDKEDEESLEDDEPSPKKKKRVNNKETHVLDDEELARKLHEDEKNLRSRRHTAKRPVERRKTAKAKKPKESGGLTGFKRIMVLSPQLAEVVGEEKMTRSDVVKKMWEIIKERKLEDPKNKRFTLCDEQLQQVFGPVYMKLGGPRQARKCVVARGEKSKSDLGSLKVN